MKSPLSPEAVAQMVADLRAADKPLIRSGPFSETRARLVTAADMLTTLAAENATLRAERDELDFLRHEGGPDSVAAMEIELATLRAERDRLATVHKQLMQSLDAANARADQARDAALVEAAGTLDVQALDADAQAKRFRGGSDPWADRTARSRAMRNSADTIRALRDKPVPAVLPLLPDMVDAATAAGVVVWWDNEAQEIKMAVTVQEAARVLLTYLSETQDSVVWETTEDAMAVPMADPGDVIFAALRAITGGGDE